MSKIYEEVHIDADAKFDESGSVEARGMSVIMESRDAGFINRGSNVEVTLRIGDKVFKQIRK